MILEISVAFCKPQHCFPFSIQGSELVYLCRDLPTLLNFCKLFSPSNLVSAHSAVDDLSGYVTAASFP